jgi:DNA-binding Lrp family transcriptional regulator
MIQEADYNSIQGWMYHLGLNSIAEISAYSIVYGFSKDGSSEFKGSISYIQEWLLCSRPTAIKIMKSLEDKGLVVKRQIDVNGVIFNRYSVNLEVVKKFNYQSNNFTGGSKEILPNIEYNNINKESTHFVRTKEKTDTSNFDLTFIRPDYTDCVLEWLTHKKKIKKGYKTEAGIRKMYNALFQMSHGDSSIAQMIIDQSIANNWDGLFPLKAGTSTMSKLQQQEQESYEKQKRVLEMMAESERRKQNGDYGVARGIADLFG